MITRLADEARTHDALLAFLDEHLGAEFRDDVGPLLGQASVLGNAAVADADDMWHWSEAVSAAVSSEATRVTGSARRNPAKNAVKLPAPHH